MSGCTKVSCDYCNEEVEFNDVEEFYVRYGWLDVRLDGYEGEIDEPDVLDFCSKECVYLYFEEQVKGE